MLYFRCASLVAIASQLACAESDRRSAVHYSDSSSVVHYAGELSERDVKIGVVLTDARFQAYLCGAGPNPDPHTGWFEGTSMDGRFEAEVDRWTLRGKRLTTGVSGELVPPSGEALAWSAAAVPGNGRHGVFRGQVDDCRVGAIVWPESSGEGCKARGSVCGDERVDAQVTPAACPVADLLEATAIVAGVPTELELERVWEP